MSNQPYFVAGAGDLISHVRLDETEFCGRSYRFNLYRILPNGDVTNWLRPGDLRDIIKACQVLAFSIADDGWIEDSLRLQVAELADDLQVITDSWKDSDA